MIFESHAHYEDESYNEDRDRILGHLSDYNIETVINVGSSMNTSEECLKLAESYPNVYAAVGVHPSEISGLREDSLRILEEMAENPKVAAIGEIGLDYHWDKEEEVRNQQKVWFCRQLLLAKKVQLPVIIHSREAAADTLQLMKQNHGDEIKGVIHCYSYSPEIALDYLKMGYYIGVGGVVTFKNARHLKETVQSIPMERILLETDCPYMAPEPHRGERNSSLYLPLIAEKIAELKGCCVEEVIEITKENARRLFTRVN
ncbi:MAG: TatD family hydrolase [Lachnospiraceae bacterium]